MKRLLGYFIKGLLIFVPVALTVTLISWVINKFDSLLNLQVPGLGFALIVAFITFMAAFTAVRMRDNSFRDKYQRYVHRSPEDADLKRKARTAVTTKMARVVYALIKYDCDYRQRFELGFPNGSTPLTRAVEAFGTS